MPSWKKVITSGSNASLSSLTTSGNISGSSTSTGSFGRVSTSKVRASQLRISKNTTEASDTTISVADFGGGNLLTIANGSRQLKFDGRNNQGVAGLYFDNNNTGMLGSKSSTSTEPGLKFKGDEDTGIGRADANQLSLITGGVEAFRVTSTLISGSSTSTGSFGHLMVGGGNFSSASLASAVAGSGGGSGISDVVEDTSPQLGGDLDLNSNDITGTGNINIAGNLTVLGTTSTISTTNIKIGDPFGFFATGSAGTNVDGGIIIQSGSAVDSGSAMYHDISTERWSVAKGIASTATTVTDSEWQGYVATVFTSSGSPVGESPKYGVGEIHIDENGDIFIYS